MRPILFFLSAVLCTAQTDPAALSSEAKRAMESRQFARAAELYQQLIAIMPGVAGLRLNLGLARFSEGNFAEAKPAFEAAVKMDPSIAPAWLMLGLAERKLGQPARAAAALEKAVAAQPANTLARLELADSYLALERHRDAVAQFRKLTELSPNDATGWYGLGASAEAAAKDGMAELDRTAPASPFRDALYARLRADAFQYRSAYHAYRKALAAKPDFPGLHLAISRIYEAENKPEWAAIERKREVPKPAARPATGRTAEAVYWRALADCDLARDAFARLEKLPESAELHWHRAALLREQGRYPDSAEEFRKAISRKPNLPQLKRELARVLWLGRDYEAALPLLEELARQEPQSPDLAYQLGDCLLNADRVDDALRQLEKAVKLDPRTPAIKGALGTALARAGKNKEGIPLLEAALSADDDGRFHFQLSRAYQTAGDPAKAAQTLERRERKLAEIERQKNADPVTAPAADARD